MPFLLCVYIHRNGCCSIAKKHLAQWAYIARSGVLLSSNTDYLPGWHALLQLWDNELSNWAIWDIDNVLRREMRYRCVTCGIEFDTIEQLASHKQQHRASSRSSSGVICLGCGRSIPLKPSRINYRGPLTCPNCQRTMTVVIENGEVCVARLG